MLSKSENRHLAEVHKKLLTVPSDERSFIRLEGIFFDVISLARLHSGEVEENQLLYNLKKIQNNEFQLTQVKYSKVKQCELVIKAFKKVLAKELSSYLSLSILSPS